MTYPHDLDIAALRASIVRHEGLRLMPYRDHRGFLTIGYGRNLDAKGISKAEADTLLEHDLADVVLALSRGIPWWDAQDGVRKRVLAEMAFQMGAKAVLTDWQPTLRLMANGDYHEAAEHMRHSAWGSEQTPERARELARLMERGE
jgi:lysozyme